MFSKIKTMKSTKNYLANIEKAKTWIKEADCILIGAGAGLSASGGINYCDENLVKKWFLEYHKLGYKSLPEIQSIYWRYETSNPQRYWGYWARHIYHIRYEMNALEVYKDLFNLVKDKEYFICTTNADGQFEKSEFLKEKIFSPQGNYAFFQCSEPCTQDIYPNDKYINKMLNNMISPYEIDKEYIPFCPKCGKPLIPNLRCDEKFVGAPHMKNIENYEKFIFKNKHRKMILLELGVGFNTPGIIRFPFESMAERYKDTKLIRININDDNLLTNISDKSIMLKSDIQKIITLLLKEKL